MFAGILSLAMVGCKPTEDPDTGSSDVAGSAGKSLVKKIVVELEDASVDADYSVNATATLNFTYDEGRLATISGNGNYAGKYTEPGYEEGYEASGSANVGLAYDGDRIDLTISLTGTATDSYDGSTQTVQVSASGTSRLQLNADKALETATTSFMYEGETEKMLVGYEYENKYLSRSIIPYGDAFGGSSYGNTYVWTDGNMTGMDYFDDADAYKKEEASSLGRFGRVFFPLAGVWGGQTSMVDMSKSGTDNVEMVYSERLNKTNVDFAMLTWLLYWGPEDYTEFLGVFGFTGTMSKNLPVELYERDDYDNERYQVGHVEYTFNDNDLVTGITVFNEENQRLGSISIGY